MTRCGRRSSRGMTFGSSSTSRDRRRDLMKAHRPVNRVRLLACPCCSSSWHWWGQPVCPPHLLLPAPPRLRRRPRAGRSLRLPHLPCPKLRGASQPSWICPVGVDSDGNFYHGDTKAPVKLVEFSDFQCPYCGRHITETGPPLDATYVATGQVLHVFRHLPVHFHPNALPAAKAATAPDSRLRSSSGVCMIGFSPIRRPGRRRLTPPIRFASRPWRWASTGRSMMPV